MADFSRFRSSFNGFNREDVSNYIEKISAEHQRELRAVKQELEALRTEKADAEAALLAAKQELEAQKSAPVPAEPILAPDLPAEELEAYRRAEAAERTARDRAEKLKGQLRALCDRADGRFADSRQRVEASLEATDSCLAQLHTALNEMKDVFAQTRDELSGLRPEA